LIEAGAVRSAHDDAQDYLELKTEDPKLQLTVPGSIAELGVSQI
jgi:uncharacterized protein (DUF736 family)